MIKYEVEKSYSDPEYALTEEELLECLREDSLFDLITYSAGSGLYDSEEEARAEIEEKQSYIRKLDEGNYEIVLYSIYYGEAVIQKDKLNNGEIVEYESLDELNELVRAPFDEDTRKLLEELKINAGIS